MLYRGQTLRVSFCYYEKLPIDGYRLSSIVWLDNGFTPFQRKPASSSSPTAPVAGGSSGYPRSELVEDILEGRRKRESTKIEDKKKSMIARILHEFMVMLSVCHTVIPEKQEDDIIYHAASPGEFFFQLSQPISLNPLSLLIYREAKYIFL